MLFPILGIMSVIMRTFLHDDDEIVAAKNSFIGFRVLANASGIKTHWVPMKEYHYDLHGLADKINNKTLNILDILKRI